LLRSRPLPKWLLDITILLNDDMDLR